MSTVRVGDTNAVPIPKTLWKKFGLKSGDKVDVAVDKDQIVCRGILSSIEA